MPRYVDGFVIPIPRKNLAKYRRIAALAGKVWKQHGALEYIEAVGDDLKTKMGTGFAKAARAKKGETVLFSWIVYKSKAHRNAVNKKVMKDPRIVAMMNEKATPFDLKRMVMGGFRVIVDR